MNPNHLSTGDLITYQGKPVRVVVISKNFLGVEPAGQTKLDCDYLYIDDPGLAPISITPDILFANDFTSQPQVGYVFADGRITLDPSIPNYPRQWYAHIDNDDFQSIASCDLDYLHQLQHLLRICNLEIDWKL